MASSRETIALRKSYAVFKKGVDPATVIAALYSELLLTREEKDKAMQEKGDNQAEEIFTSLERRVSANSSVFHKLVQTLLREPALQEVGKKMQGENRECFSSYIYIT